MIMHVTTNFAASAGAETMLARLLSTWRDPEVVVSLREVSDRNRRLADNPDVIYRSLGATNLFGLGRATLTLGKLISEYKPAVIVCWMYHAMIATSIATRLSRHHPRVLWTIRQALDDPSSLTHSTRLAIRLSRILSTTCDGIIYNSERAREQHRLLGFDASADCVIPNGVPLPSTYTLPKVPLKVFGYAARLHPQKDLYSFLQAAASTSAALPDVRFVTAGKNLLHSNLEVAKMVAKSGLDPARITFLGEQSDMASFYNSIDALVLSSRTEGFPNVVAEAMSYSRPIIATDVGDARAIIGDAGLVVEPKRPDLLAEAMIELGTMKHSQVAELSERARKRIERHFGIAAIAEAYKKRILNWPAEE